MSFAMPLHLVHLVSGAILDQTVTNRGERTIDQPSALGGS